MEFKEFVDYNKDNIKSRMRKLPTMVYQYGLKDNVLHDKKDSIELELTELKSTYAAQIRKKYRNVKDLKETAIKDLVTVKEEVKEKNRELNKINKLIRLSRLRMKVLADMKDMITQVGHYGRQESKATHGMNKL